MMTGLAICLVLNPTVADLPRNELRLGLMCLWRTTEDEKVTALTRSSTPNLRRADIAQQRLRVQLTAALG